ncbi:MAG: hypothetical protein JNM17_13455 [Archangium sp.]|nr:hypothetical protein [Archangium sp.]
MTTLVLFALLAQQPPAAAPVEPLSPVAPQINDAPLFDQGGRIRFGASVQGGWRTLSSSFVIDLDARVGMQVTQWWSLYGLVKVNLATSSGFTSTASGAPLIGAIGVMVETMLNNHIYFAVGPLLGYGTFSGAEIEGRAIPRLVIEQNGASFKPGFDVRLGFATARSRPPRFSRSGASIGFELVGLYHFQLSELTFGGTPPTPIAPWWVFTPMLSIGIDTR